MLNVYVSAGFILSKTPSFLDHINDMHRLYTNLERMLRCNIVLCIFVEKEKSLSVSDAFFAWQRIIKCAEASFENNNPIEKLFLYFVIELLMMT